MTTKIDYNKLFANIHNKNQQEYVDKLKTEVLVMINDDIYKMSEEIDSLKRELIETQTQLLKTKHDVETLKHELTYYKLNSIMILEE